MIAELTECYRLPVDLDSLHPKRVYLRDDPTDTIARSGLGLTVYLADPFFWATGGATEWLGRFLEKVELGEQVYFTTSRLEEWRRVQSNQLINIGAELTAVGGRPRHLLEFAVTDDYGAPRVGFFYREVHPNQEERVGHLQLFFDVDSNPDDLLALAIELGQDAPITCAVGGWCARWNRLHEATAFKHIRIWCRRYLGLDVQWADRMAYHVSTGLPGVNWLTLVGEPLMKNIEEKIDFEDLPEGTKLMRLRNAVLLRAGDAPTLGDSNSLEYPTAIAALARHLAPVFVDAPPEFPDAFGEEDTTSAWLHRFSSPEEWI